jgi:hypothetical protein
LERTRRDLEEGETGLADQIEALKAELNRHKRKNAGDLAKLKAEVDRQEQAYRKALAAWAG